MTKTIKQETPGFRNYDKWMKGYDAYYKWLDDSLERIQKNKPLHNMDKEERKKYLKSVALSLLAGAVVLQYIRDRDFYYNNEEMEILIRFKKDYKDMPEEEITWSLMKDVILILEKEEQQLVRIANSYEGNR